MKDNGYNEEVLRRFLLGDVSDDLRDAIEDCFLTDEEFSARLLVVEDETIESYLRGELLARDKELFEKAFLTNPRRRERVLAIKGVIAAANAEADLITAKQESSSLLASVFAFLSFENSFARYAFAAVVLFILFGGAWFLANRNRDERLAIANTNQIEDKTEPEKPAPSPAATNQPTPQQPTPSPTPQLQKQSEPTVAAIVLRPTLLRDPSGAAKLVLAPSVKQAKIQLNLERDNYKSYVVRITTVEGNPVWQGGPLYARKSKSGSAIIFNLSAKLLADNDYVIELSGVSEAGPIESFADYFVSVARK